MLEITFFTLHNENLYINTVYNFSGVTKGSELMDSRNFAVMTLAVDF